MHKLIYIYLIYMHKLAYIHLIDMHKLIYIHLIGIQLFYMLSYLLAAVAFRFKCISINHLKIRICVVAGNGETESQQTGVVYITENMIRKISKEESFLRIFKLALTVPRDLNKKIKVSVKYYDGMLRILLHHVFVETCLMFCPFERVAFV